MKNLEELRRDILDIVESLGYRLYDIAYSNKKVSVYIDKEDGISIDDCEKVNRNLGILLDVEDMYSNPYIFEVSSPGINRSLKIIDHFKQSIGKNCTISLHNPIGKAKFFEGILRKVTDDKITIVVKGKNIGINFNNIKKAHLKEI